MSEQVNNEYALSDLLHLEQDARSFGFEWPNETVIIEQAIDECREIEEAIANQETRERIQEEIGDLLHTAISLCVFSGFDVNETLIKINSKFGGRMRAMKELSNQLELKTLHGQSFDFMLDLWKQAKIITKEGNAC